MKTTLQRYEVPGVKERVGPKVTCIRLPKLVSPEEDTEMSEKPYYKNPFNVWSPSVNAEVLRLKEYLNKRVIRVVHPTRGRSDNEQQDHRDDSSALRVPRIRRQVSD